MVKLASCVGSDWLEDTDAEALADVTLNHFLGHQLGPDSEPLPDVGILGDHLSALIELLPLPPLAHDAFDDGAPRGGCGDCNQLAMAKAVAVGSSVR